MEFSDTVADDLKLFAKHRGRGLITNEDLKLCARKSNVRDKLVAYEKRMRVEKEEDKKKQDGQGSKKRKKVSSGSSSDSSLSSNSAKDMFSHDSGLESDGL
mmetsp:Transcript_33746/g.54145  ORF Transcript_33746/g.54145 Transcript_33746/m.54145 type:complete len:101 (+) Transcript_33746:180-482(+)